MADVYVRLSYDEYKRLEAAIRSFPDCETSHSSVEGYYHKAIRLPVGDSMFEFQGPLVMRPLDA